MILDLHKGWPAKTGSLTYMVGVQNDITIWENNLKVEHTHNIQPSNPPIGISYTRKTPAWVHQET